MKQLATALAFALASTAAATAQPVAIVGGRVVTNGPDGVLDGATVVIDGERIAAVGADVEIPGDAMEIDASGKWVTPGLFAAYAELGLVEIGGESSTDDRNASDDALFSIALHAEDGFNPAATSVAVARGDGLTRAAIATGNGSGVLGGLGAIIETSGAADSVTQPSAFVVGSLTPGQRASAGGSRPAAFASLRTALDDAAAWRDDPEEFSGDLLSAADAEALAPVLSGDIPLVLSADRASDLRALIEIAQSREGLRLVILGGAEAHLVADALADAGIGVILDPSLNLPSSFDRIGATVLTASALDAAGADFAIVSLNEPYAIPALMTQNAGLAAAHGLDREAAFDALTGAPARMFGLEADLGSLEPGKLADVLIWDGDPLEVMSGIEHVFIGGVEADTRSRQSDLRDRYLAPRAAGDLPHAYRRP
ncbi:MAG: amidohydrolase family protein [Maricaulaceae bacterium]|jgi:imidazolonepropionase-like amidohydrolase